MIDITDKKPMKRMAKAFGRIILKESTIDKIVKKDVIKGDVFETAKIAGINAVKNTPNLIPYCHQIPIESVEFGFETMKNDVSVYCTIKSVSKTGVEMEAIVGVTNALNTIWDMVKYLEKDSKGKYPSTRIESIQVIDKVKEDLEN